MTASKKSRLHPGEPVSLDLSIDLLRPMKGNPRGDDMGDVSGLVKSIEMHGFIGSLFVRTVDEGEGYEVWAGNRRLKAAKEAGLMALPCDVYELTEGQALELNMAEQINRNDLSPLQEGDACRRLMELQGYDERQVSEKFGKSTSWVTKRLALCGIAPELRKALMTGNLPVTLANALAALPTQQQQLKAFAALEERPDWDKWHATAEGDAEWLRRTQCRPLADATWKLTDAELVPEAGACSACPHNSSSAKMPGLFDNAKAKPMCGRPECFEDKALASWLARTAKQKAAGAKVLSLAEGRKLFGHGNALPSSSRYVEASDKPAKDKGGRTWSELADDVTPEHRPQLHLAQDNAGKVRSLYVTDQVMEAAAEHLKLKWAKSVVEEAEERRESLKPEARAKKDVLEAERRLVGKVRDDVFAAVIASVAADIARGNGTLPAMRLLATRVGERGIERLNAALGVTKRPKDWLEKGASQAELLALVWLAEAHAVLNGYVEFDERFVALAKAHGFKLEDMVRAQLATTKAEAAQGEE